VLYVYCSSFAPVFSCCWHSRTNAKLDSSAYSWAYIAAQSTLQVYSLYTSTEDSPGVDLRRALTLRFTSRSCIPAHAQYSPVESIMQFDRHSVIECCKALYVLSNTLDCGHLICPASALQLFCAPVTMLTMITYASDAVSDARYISEAVFPIQQA
jgi:hypothetical protein